MKRNAQSKVPKFRFLQFSDGNVFVGCHVKTNSSVIGWLAWGYLEGYD